MAGAGWRRFQPGEVLTATNLQSYGIDQSVQVYAGTAARGSAIGTAVSEGMVSYLADSDLIEVYNGSAWKQVSGLTGNVLQVYSTSKTDTYSVSNSTYQDITGLSVTITPTSTSSKILILGNLNISGNANMVGVRLVRNSTPIFIGDTSGSRLSATSAGGGMYSPTGYGFNSPSPIYLDSPGSTSSVTYKFQMVTLSGEVGYINKFANDADSISRPVVASSITVMEISA